MALALCVYYACESNLRLFYSHKKTIYKFMQNIDSWNWLVKITSTLAAKFEGDIKLIFTQCLGRIK